MVKAIESLEEYEQVINSGKPVIIDFWATWCVPCRIIAPVFENLADSGINPGIEAYKVDTDSNDDIAQAAGVRMTPTFIAYKDGKTVGNVVGANPAALEELMKNTIHA
ncbi:thioredoxin-like protein [Schizophyllum commune]